MAELIKKEFTVTWRIENFAYFSATTIRSSEFSVDSLDGGKFELIFHSKEFVESEKQDCVKCEVEYHDVSKASDIEYKIEMVVQGTPQPGIIKNQQPGNVKHEDFLLERKKFDEFLISGDTFTFRCLMTKDEVLREDNDFADSCVAVTKIEIERGFLKSLIKLQDSNKLTYSVSPYFNVVLAVAEDKVEYEMIKTDKENRARHVFGKFLLIDTKGHVIDQTDVHKFFSKDDTRWSSSKSWKKCDNSDMLFQCEVSTGGDPINSLVYKRGNEVMPRFATFEDFIRNLYYNKRASDIKVKVGETEMEAHEAILIARSPVLNVMIEEIESNLIEIKDYDLKTVQNFLYFLYSDEMLESDGGNVVKLLLMAHEFKVETLKARCISFLMINMEDSFVIEAHSASLKIGSKQLETVASLWLKMNCFGVDPDFSKTVDLENEKLVSKA